MVIKQRQNLKPTMKPIRDLSKINFALIALAVALAGVIFLTGCASTGDGAADHSTHQGSCH